jgi:choline dehydrogenase-like flavoprotein
MGTAERPYFAAVIGSGFGGAVAACRLAQARATLVEPHADQMGICLLERGRRFGRADFPRLQLPDYLTMDPARLTSKRLPEIARLFWTHDQGLWELRNLGELRVAQAAGLGGGSLIYANVHLRPPDQVFGEWPSHCGAGCRCVQAGAPRYSRAGLRRYYDLVADMLDVEPLPAGLRDRYGKTAAMAEVARSLFGEADAAGPAGSGSTSQRFLHPPLAVRFAETAEPLQQGQNRFGREQGDCTGCGNCTIGCQEAAKNSLDLNYLALAEDLGVEVRTLSEVQTLEPLPDDGPIRIVVTDHLHPGEETVLHAQHVFLCAGAVGSTEILLRSRALAGPKPSGGARAEQRTPAPPALGGHRLGQGFYGNGDNLAAVFDAKMPLHASVGPTVTASLLHTGPPAATGALSPGQPRAPWFLVQDGGVPPSLAEGLGLFRSPLWLGRNRFRPASRPPGPGPAARPPAPPVAAGVAAVASPPAPRHPILAHAGETRPAEALARGLRQFLPRALDPWLDRLSRIDRVASAQLRQINTRVVQAIDRGLRGRLVTRSLLPLRRLVADDEQLLRAVTAGLIDQYPLLRDLFAPGRAIELVLALARQLLFAGPPSPDAGLLLVMGPDQRGKLVYHNGHLRIRWQTGDNAPLFSLQERLLRDAAGVLQAELRTNPDWTLGRTPLTAHAQGGCAMGGSADAGVVRPCGQLWTCDRVYVLDGAAFPGSVGVNPSSTIAAVAERNVEQFIRHRMGLAPEAYRDRMPPGAPPRPPARAQQRRTRIDGFDQLLAPELPPPLPDLPRSRPIGLHWQEEMSGHLSTDPAAGPLAFESFSRFPRAARTDLDVRPFLAAERRGPLAGLRVDAHLDVSVDDLDAFLMERRPRLRVQGTVGVVRHLRHGAGRQREEYPAEGRLCFELHTDDARRASRLWAQDRKLVAMTYELRVKVGRRRVPLLARKLMVDDPGMDLWSDLSTVFVVARTSRWWVGVMRVRLSHFLQHQLRNMEVLGDVGAGPMAGPDDVTRGWAFLRFASFFVGGVKNVYSQWL